MQNLVVQPFPSYTHRLGDRRIAGFIDNIDAIKQAVAHILATERYAYEIYDDTYGIEIQQFIGADFAYVEANIGRIIRDALMQDDRIVNVTIDRIMQTDLNSVLIEFTVVSKLGTFGAEVVINV